MTGDPPIYPFAAAPDDPRWTDGTWGAQGNVPPAYGHGMTPAEVQTRGLERIARGDFFTLDEVVEYAAWLLRQTGNRDEPTPPCEGSVVSDAAERLRDMLPGDRHGFQPLTNDADDLAAALPELIALVEAVRMRNDWGIRHGCQCDYCVSYRALAARFLAALAASATEPGVRD